MDFIDEEPAALETKARAFAERGKHTDGWAFNSILGFMQFQKERFNRKEITAGTIRNYVKNMKLFCQMADIHILWDKITRGLPPEIKKLCQYPDRRIKPLVYTKASSGIRVGAWDYLHWEDIQPIEKDSKIVAARMLVSTKFKIRPTISYTASK